MADGAVNWFFGSAGDAILRRADLPGWWYVIAAVALATAAGAIVLRRYARIAA